LAGQGGVAWVGLDQPGYDVAGAGVTGQDAQDVAALPQILSTWTGPGRQLSKASVVRAWTTASRRDRLEPGSS
jgi:hypothetical protein